MVTSERTLAVQAANIEYYIDKRLTKPDASYYLVTDLSDSECTRPLWPPLFPFSMTLQLDPLQTVMFRNTLLIGLQAHLSVPIKELIDVPSGHPK